MGFVSSLLIIGVLSLPVFGGVALGAEPGPRVAAKLLEAGRSAARRGGYAEADEALRGALAACRARADERCAWEALSSLVGVSLAQGKLVEARGFAQEAATTAHRLRDRSAQGESYRLLAEVLAEEARAEEARSAAQRALAVGRELERDDLRAWALTVLGDLELAASRPEASCRAFDEALSAGAAAGLAPLRLRARMGLGRCLTEGGEFGKAHSALEAAFLDALRLGDKLSVARLLQEMGRLEAHRGEPSLGEELLLEALGKFRSLGARVYVERVSADLARLRAEASLPTDEERAKQAAEARRQGLERLEAGDVEAAVRLLREAISLSPYDPEPRLVLARAYRTMGLESLAEEESRYASAVSQNNTPFDLTTSNPRHLDYFARARRQIDWVYVVPAEVSGGELEGSVRLAFTLDRSGRLTDASLETPSGSSVLDEAALTTLRLAEPFAPFPDGVSQGKLTIVARFVYEQDLAGGPPEDKAESRR